MKKIIFIFINICIWNNLFGSSLIYTGIIGDKNIEFQFHTDEYIYEGMYFNIDDRKPVYLEYVGGYDRDDDLIFHRFDNDKKHIATMTINDSGEEEELKGTYVDLKNNQTLDIKLKLKYDVTNWGDFSEEIEVFQMLSMEDKYFSAVIPNGIADYPFVSQINVYDKKSNKLLEIIYLMEGVTKEYNTFYTPSGNIAEIEDYNFDGIMDFKLYGQVIPDFTSNGFSQLFMYDKVKKKFVGTGLAAKEIELDKKSKKVKMINYHNDYENMYVVNIYKIENEKFLFEEEYNMHYDNINKEYMKTSSVYSPEPLKIDHIPKFATYEGTIAEMPVYFQFHFKDDGIIEGIYHYDKYKIPISLENITQGNNPEFFEYDKNKNIASSITFDDLTPENKEVNGVFLNKQTGQVLDVLLNLKKAYLTKKDYVDGPDFIYQKEATENFYFKVIVGNWNNNAQYNEFYIVKICSKKTGKETHVEMYEEEELRFMPFNNVKIIGKSEGNKIPDFEIRTSLSEYTRVNSENLEDALYRKILITNNGQNTKKLYYKKKRDKYIPVKK